MGGLWDELNPVAGRERSRHVALGNQRCLLPVHLHSFIANPRQVLHLKCESLSCRLHLPLLCSFLCYGCVRVCETGARVQSYCPAVAGIKRFSWCLVIVVQPLDMCLWQSATKTYSHQLGTTQLSMLIVINAHMYPQHLPPVVCLRLWCHSWSWHPSYGRSPRALRWILSSSWVVPVPFIIGFSVGSLLPPQPDRIDLWVRPASLYVTEPYKQSTALTALFSASFPSDTKLCGAVTSTNLD